MDTRLISGWALASKYALLTLGCLLAYPRAVAHDQGVILVEQLGVVREIFHENLLEPPVMESAAEPAQPLQQTVGIGINDEDRLLGGVKQDTVGCLLADSINRKQLFPECRQLLVKE